MRLSIVIAVYGAMLPQEFLHCTEGTESMLTDNNVGIPTFDIKFLPILGNEVLV